MAELVYERDEGDITITVPDQWTVADTVKFAAGYESCPVEVEGVKELYGAIALIQRIDGIDLDDPMAIPSDVYTWLRTNVLAAYTRALMPKKKTS